MNGLAVTVYTYTKVTLIAVLVTPDETPKGGETVQLVECEARRGGGCPSVHLQAPQALPGFRHCSSPLCVLAGQAVTLSLLTNTLLWKIPPSPSLFS